MKPIILTGDRPTGPLHLGHFVGSLKNRVALQNSHSQFIIIADAQALTDNYENPQQIRENVHQVMLDYLAAGLTPDLNCFFVQSQIPELYELTCYFLNLVTVARLERNPTVKDEIRQKNMKDSVPAGFFCYPVSQAADILAFQTDLVPVGDDQHPMIEQTNEIARRFNFLYKTNLLKEVKAITGATGRLPGIDGKSKMSKSLGNSITLSESSGEIKRKVRLMYTDPNHIRVEDPGTVEGNVVFTFLDAFDPQKEEVESLKNQYRQGGLGDGVIKNRLTNVLEETIAPMRSKRQEYEKEPAFIQELLKKGNEQARNVAAQTLSQVKRSMGILY